MPNTELILEERGESRRDFRHFIWLAYTFLFYRDTKLSGADIRAKM